RRVAGAGGRARRRGPRRRGVTLRHDPGSCRAHPARSVTGSAAVSVRSVAQRAVYVLKTNSDRYPPLALGLARLRHEGVVLEPGTDLLIESFPRCASSFALAAFRLAQEPREVRVAYQTHAPGHVIAAVRRGIPALVLVREPTDTVVSNLFRHPERGVNGLLRGYL